MMAEVMPTLVPHDPVVATVVRDYVNGDGHESLCREHNGTCLPADASFEPHGTLARQAPRSVDGRQFPHRATGRKHTLTAVIAHIVASRECGRMTSDPRYQELQSKPPPDG